jgi:plastocyanin
LAAKTLIQKRRNSMSRTFRGALAAASGLALALAATAPAAPIVKTVQGSVGPGFTINLTLSGKKVTTLKKGARYRFLISDRSSIHNFHLSGPGLNRALTSVDFTGTKSVVLTLKKGAYRYVCEPHSDSMHGSFRVV